MWKVIGKVVCRKMTEIVGHSHTHFWHQRAVFKAHLRAVLMKHTCALCILMPVLACDYVLWSTQRSFSSGIWSLRTGPVNLNDGVGWKVMGPLLYVHGHMRLISYLKTFEHKSPFFRPNLWLTNWRTFPSCSLEANITKKQLSYELKCSHSAGKHSYRRVA